MKRAGLSPSAETFGLTHLLLPRSLRGIRPISRRKRLLGFHPSSPPLLSLRNAPPLLENRQQICCKYWGNALTSPPLPQQSLEHRERVEEEATGIGELARTADREPGDNLTAHLSHLTYHTQMDFAVMDFDCRGIYNT